MASAGRHASTDQLEEEEEVAKRIPDLDISQLRYLAAHAEYEPAKRKANWEKLIERITELEMAPYYEDVCHAISRPVDQALLDKLKGQNREKLDQFKEEVKVAEENEGESEVRACWLRKSEYLCQIGAKEEAVSAFRQTFEKTVGIGNRIDLVFHQIRLGLFYMDHQLIQANISKAKDLMEQGGDWDRKNRLKSYEGLYKLAVRDFKTAAALLLDAIPTFGSYELMTYEQLTSYTVIASMLALERADIDSKLRKSAEIQEQLHSSSNLALLRDYIESFYNCNYSQFFRCLARLEETEQLKFNRYLGPHYAYYARSMRIKAYDQFLTPYKTVKMEAMAAQFGVSVDFIDRELHSLIANGSLHCRIDAVRGIVETNRPDLKNDQYRTLIRDGDILLNRLQKLARVIND